MQSVSSTFTTATGSSTSNIAYGVMVSFTKGINSSVNFFTIGTSTIGGPDMIMGANGIPAFMDIYQYTDYSDWAMGWSVTRNLGQYPYGAFGAQGTITLDNTNRQFLPNFDPVIGSYITIGRPLKISAGFNNETINLFTGTGIQPKNDVQHRQFDLTAYDAMDYLNNTVSTTTPMQVNVYADQIIAALLSEVGFAPSQFIAEQSLQQPIGFFSPYGLLIGDIIQSLCEAEQAIFFFDENGLAHFWNRQHIANNLTSQWTFDESSNIINVIPEETPILNDVVIQANPRAVAAKQQIWQMTSATQIPAPSTAVSYTNLITNPNFETGTANWTAVNSTITAQQTQYYSGVQALQVVGNAGFVPSTYIQPSLTNNTTYTAHIRVKGTSGQTITMYDAVTGGQTSPAFVLTGAWDRFYWTWTVTASSTRLGIQGNTNAATFYLDSVMLQVGSTNISATFFDGNTPYTSSYVYVWNGTANASTSSAIPCGSVTVSADFQDDDGALPVTSVDFPLYYNSNNAALTSNYTANYNSDSSGSDASGVVFIQGTSLTNQASGASTLNGSNYQVTFLNTATTPVYITQMALYGTPAKVTYVINTEYKDTASIALYGTNPANNGQPLVIQNDLIQNPSTANSNAYQLVTDFAHPYQRLTADIFPVPQLQIGDTVTVNLQDANQSLSYTVVGNTVTASTDDLIQQTLELEVRVLTKYFQINVSNIGGTDQIAP